MTSSVDGRGAVDVAYFTKAFNTVSHNILVDKLMKYRLGKCTVK